VITKWERRTTDHAEPKDRKAKAFVVPVEEIRANGYDLSINRYKEIAYTAPQYDPPKAILKRMHKLEAEITRDLDDLEGMLA
jgi:type I restriction enzyme M protein